MSLNSSYGSGFRLADSKHYYDTKNNRQIKNYYWRLFVLNCNTENYNGT